MEALLNNPAFRIYALCSACFDIGALCTLAIIFRIVLNVL